MERGAVYLALPEWRASDAGIHHLRRRPKAAGAGGTAAAGRSLSDTVHGPAAPSPWASGPSPGPAGRPADAGAGGPQRGVSGGLPLYRPLPGPGELLSARDGGEVLARELRREYGISLLLDPARDQLDRADALLLYAPRPDLAGDNAVLWGLYPGGELGRGRLPLVLPAALAEQVEPNCGREQLTAALYALGVLPLEAVLAEIPS